MPSAGVLKELGANPLELDHRQTRHRYYPLPARLFYKIKYQERPVGGRVGELWSGQIGQIVATKVLLKVKCFVFWNNRQSTWYELLGCFVLI